MEEQVTDTQTAVVADTSTEAQPQATTETAQTTEAYVPFATGKEKLKINGQEEELDWETTKRYAQLGKAGQKAMQEKAESERKQKDFFAKLVQGLEQDPAATYEALTGKKPSFSVQRSEQAAAGHETNDPSNPLELRLRQTEERLQNLLQQQELASVDQERQLVEKELSDASAKFPELNTPWLKSYVKQQYKSLLQQGVYDMSIDDVAFLVAEDVKSQNANKHKTLVQQVDKNKERAVISAPRGTGQESKKPMTLDDVKRLAGRQV